MLRFVNYRCHACDLTTLRVMVDTAPLTMRMGCTVCRWMTIHINQED